MSIYPAIRIEGGLLGPETFDQLLAGELPRQRPEDFGLPAKTSLTDEIAAVFADARALWGVFQNRLQRVAETEPATSVTRDAWVIPFLGLLGYEPRYNTRPYDVDDRSLPISHRTDAAADAPPLHVVGARQELGRVPESGRPRMAPHTLVQEYLNRTEQLWGIATNGLVLRLLRDCTFVRRQAYVEFDLHTIVEEQRFQDFAVLFRLLHRTRLPHGAVDAADCLLEKYYAQSVEQGGRVRDHLRDGVKECIMQLAAGFLSHRNNDELRARLAPGYTQPDRVSPEKLYRELLRLVYRLLFLLVSEDRGILGRSAIYREHYGVARLRRLADQRAAATDDTDLCESLRLLWRLLSNDQPQQGLEGRTLASLVDLPVLNGELFAPLALDDFTISNRDLLGAFWHLGRYQENRSAPWRRVNYAALDVEELGSVYESLLDFHPAVGHDSGRPMFDLLEGSERKTTGSYYTPPELVAELVKSALEPVLRERLAARPSEPEQAILSLRVCDPACGSGHFLLAAARRLGKELARVRTGHDEPPPEVVREAVRDVISHSIYGVDKNPLAVDLCQVALWLESHTAGKPLTFLRHHIRPGDSLVGVFELATLADGIPDKAFEPRQGDDKRAARELLRRNRDERAGQRDLFESNREVSLERWNALGRQLDTIADDSPEAIRHKNALFDQAHADPLWRRQKLACDLCTAAFFQPLMLEEPAITSAALVDVLSAKTIDLRVEGLAAAIAGRQLFFHWPLEFPEVFADGGFDVVLSNPPWERLKLQEQEFFAARDARIAGAANKAARRELIATLPETNPELHRQFTDALRGAAGASALMRNGGRFPLAGRGDINTYAVFAELAATALRPTGRAGIIVPTGIATDDTTKELFWSLVEAGRLVALTGFENEEFIFPAIHHAFKFCIVTIGPASKSVTATRVAFYMRRFAQLSEQHRFFWMAPVDFCLINPNTRNCPLFRSVADAELTKAIYRRVPILWRETSDGQHEANPWRLSFKTLFHMANDSHHFRTADELRADGYRLEGNTFASEYNRYLPLYEAKMLHQFDHRFSTYEGASEKQVNVGILPQPTEEQKRDPRFVVQPRYWIREDIVESAIPKYPEPLAVALLVGHRPSIQGVLSYWSAGFYLEAGNEKMATRLLESARRFDMEVAVTAYLDADGPEESARELQKRFPLQAADSAAIIEHLGSPEPISRHLVERFSPKWLMGWRDITNAGNERTTISSILPKAAVGDTFLLMFPQRVDSLSALSLLAVLNSHVQDYCARQKVGGTHMKYNVFRQLAVLPPESFQARPVWAGGSVEDWLVPRVLELTLTANDLMALGCVNNTCTEPFCWNVDRRYEIRCEIDAAMFHLYLPSDASGEWEVTSLESREQMAELRSHFPTPRHAVVFVMDQFPITRQKDEAAHGSYRTRDRILAIYDTMLAAHRSGRPYETALAPPPGVKA